MQKLLTVALALGIVASIASAQQASHSHLPARVDGSVTPDLISDPAAFSSLMRLINYLGEDRARDYLQKRGMGDPDLVLQQVQRYTKAVATLDAEAGRLKDENWPEPGKAVLDELTAIEVDKRELFRQIAQELPRETWEYARSLKSRMITSRSPDVPPSQWEGGRR